MKYGVMLVLVSCSFFSLFARNALESLQDIHKQVGSSLLSIRKSFPESQQQVYTAIDQVSKLCDLSKKQYFKRKTLKEALASERTKNEQMTEKVKKVAQKIMDLQAEVADKDQKIIALLQKQGGQVEVAAAPKVVPQELPQEKKAARAEKEEEKKTEKA